MMFKINKLVFAQMLITAGVGVFSTKLLAEDQYTELEEVTVTGSQIKGADIAGALPVTVMDSSDMAVTGALDGDELLRSIPQIGSVGFGASRGGIVVVNGMSPSRRNNKFANSGIVVEINIDKDIPKYDQFGPLKGLEYQKNLERLAFTAGGRTQTAPNLVF
mgnify:CR=1 FL=1